MPLYPTDLTVVPFDTFEPLDHKVFANLKLALNQLERPTVEDLLILARDLYFSYMDDGLDDAEWDLAFERAELINGWLANRQLLHE